MNANNLWQQLVEREGSNAVTNGGDLLNRFLNSGAAGGLLGGALSGGLLTLLTGKRGKKLAKSALKVGGLAAVGSLAYIAYQRYQQQARGGTSHQPQTALPAESSQYGEPPVESGFLPPPSLTSARDALGLALVRAMIAAAKSDDHLDQKERTRIFEQIAQLDLGAEDKAFLFEELGKPLDVAAIVKLGVTPEAAAEIYTASVLAVDIDTPAEQTYLQTLAARLNLEPALVQQIHAAVASATTEQAAETN